MKSNKEKDQSKNNEVKKNLKSYCKKKIKKEQKTTTNLGSS
jgi:hypothetical protein